MFAEMMKGVGEHDTIGRHHVHCACVVCGGVECEVGGVGGVCHLKNFNCSLKSTL